MSGYRARYDKLAANCLAFINLASIRIGCVPPAGWTAERPLTDVPPHPK
jgi:hypothetical protein